MSLIHEVISIPLPQGDYAAAQRIEAFKLVAEDCGGTVGTTTHIPCDNIAVLRVKFSMGEVPARFVTFVQEAGATRMAPQPS